VQTLRAIAVLIDRYRPEALVIEDFTIKGARRSSRIRKLYRALIHLAETEQVDVHRVSRTQVKLCFASVGATTKHEIAVAIARQILDFAHRLPRTRKIWMSEDPRQNLFDAAAIGLTYFANSAGNDHPMPLA
jgi:Holliday junction resolvasome RuvABC endonuclease subunit